MPGAAETENHLAAALARTPWEIARPSAKQPTLGERNLLVRIVHDMQAPFSQPVELAPDEPLRVLFVFAKARGSRPLGARQERLDLLRLFSNEIYPKRRVVAHFLTHGVTRERLIDQIQQSNGYHLVHWSGHGNLNLLELAKPNALGFDATLRDIDLKLRGELGRYHYHVKAWPADAIYRDASAEFTGPARQERLTRNLIRALQDEAILLVLDNFETNLKSQAEPSSIAGQPVWACQDPAWDQCLKALADELVGSRSRVLITTRRPLAALTDGAGCSILLGPLPSTEAALFLRAHPALSRMAFGPDAGEKALALRLLNASRFHPLLMDRLARLAADPTRRDQLLQALDTLEQTRDFAQLPALFATTPGDAKELDYLNDALATSLDQLIRDASPDARRLLWLIAVANEPVALELLNSVWSEAPSPHPQMQPLLRHLVSVGLVTEERDGPDDANPDLACHELVRERIRAWMEQQPQDRGEWTENAIRLAYAERLEAVYSALQHRNMTAALEAGSRALVYCVQAGSWDRLGGFASSVVTSACDPRLLEGLIPHLQTAAESAPALWRGQN